MTATTEQIAALADAADVVYDAEGCFVDDEEVRDAIRTVMEWCEQRA